MRLIDRLKIAWKILTGRTLNPYTSVYKIKIECVEDKTFEILSGDRFVIISNHVQQTGGNVHAKRPKQKFQYKPFEKNKLPRFKERRAR